MAGGFETWWNENKNSDHLRESYENYKQDYEQATGEKAPTFKQWAKAEYQED